MNTTPLSHQPETSFHARNAFLMAGIMTAILVVVTAVFGYFAIQDGAWQLFGITGAVAIYLVIAIISLWLIRRQHHITGAWLLLLGCAFCALAVSALVANLGVWLGLIAFLPAAQIASLSLPTRQSGSALAAGAIIGAAAILIDLMGLPGRIIFPALQSFIPWAGSILILAYVVLFVRQLRDFSLQSKLAIAFVALTAASVAGVAFIITRQVDAALTQRVGDGLQIEAESQTEAINLFFHEKVSQLQVMALTNVIREGVVAQNRRYSGSEAEILAEIQRLDAHWVAAPDDDPLIEQVITPFAHLNRVAFQLIDLHENLPDHIEVFVTDRYGATVAATNRLSDYYQADERWWQVAWNDGQGAVYISDPEFDESAGANALLLAVPIYEEDSGEVVGILRSTLNVNALFDNIGKLQFGETGHSVLFNGQGDVIYDPFVSDTDDSSKLPDNLIQEFIEEEHGHFDVALDEHGDLSVFGHSTLHSADEVNVEDRSLTGQIAKGVLDLGWIVVARQEASEALAPITTITRTIQLVGLSIIILVTILAIFLARNITRPILTLNKATEMIAEGDLDVQLPIAGRDEIGQLTNNFRRMVGQLQQTLGNLQARGRDLSLAVDVGRELTQVRDLEGMLQNAVDIIQERYDLYYAQVYLADPAGNSLILRAGTGEPGQKLVQRGHRLPIGVGSINGTAATNRQPVVVTDTTTTVGHRANPLLPLTRSELAIPLMAEDKLVGVLDLQSDQPGGLTDENIPGFTALAAQLAVSIQNAALFSETQHAQAQIEAQSRRLAEHGWQNFLDGIDRRERLVSAYDLASEEPMPDLAESAVETNEVSASIAVAGADVGAVRLADYEGRTWTEQEKDIMTAVAQKVATQVENLRLLAEADKYRAESEAVARRLTREGWQAYQDEVGLSAPGFVYQQQEVLPLTEAVGETAVNQPITVYGEPIGELSLAGVDELDDEEKHILESIIEKVSDRLEAIRLSQQTEHALAVTEVQAERLAYLNELANALGEADTINEAFMAVEEQIGNIISHDRLSLTMLDADRQHLEVYALDGVKGVIPVGTTLPVQGTAIGAAVTQQQMINTVDLQQSDYLENIQLAKQGLRSTLVVPLVTGRTVLGTLNLASQSPAAFDAQDENMMRQIAPLLASTIESQRLFAEAQEQAKRERLLNQIGEKIRGTVTVESALQTAIEELGQALQVQHAQLNLTVNETEQDGMANGRHETITQS